jgi:hypothetical protein
LAVAAASGLPIRAPETTGRRVVGGEPGASGPSGDTRPDAYLLVAAGNALCAPTLEELTEIAECAVAAGDEIELVRARERFGWRLLRDEECVSFLRLLAARLD